MKKFLIAIAISFALLNVTQADELDVYHRLNVSQTRVARTQQSVAPGQDLSNSYPTQYVDPNDLDDIKVDLVDQDVVPAEPTPVTAGSDAGSTADGAEQSEFSQSPEGIVAGEDQIIDPAVVHNGVACGCGESPPPPISWSDEAAGAAGAEVTGRNSSCGCSQNSCTSRNSCKKSTCCGGNGIHLTRLFHHGNRSCNGNNCSQSGCTRSGGCCR